MTHRFPVKEIAIQAGVGVATVDRVINNRAHVAPQTRRRVIRAIAELEAQEAQLSAIGRRLFIDVIIEAPERFQQKVITAANRALSSFHTNVVRLRFHLSDHFTSDALEQVINRLISRGSSGVCLKVRDNDPNRKLIEKLAAMKIPVVTFVTDVVDSARIGYVGIDNASSGAIAAHLIGKIVSQRQGQILLVTSQRDFEGEATRLKNFRSLVMQSCPFVSLVELSGTDGQNAQTHRMLDQSLAHAKNLLAVYSMGGGNSAILSVLDERDISPMVFVAHDLDKENRELLRAGRIDYVIEHDLEDDLGNLFRMVANFQSTKTFEFSMHQSSPQIITKFQLT